MLLSRAVNFNELRFISYGPLIAMNCWLVLTTRRLCSGYSSLLQVSCLYNVPKQSVEV